MKTVSMCCALLLAAATANAAALSKEQTKRLTEAAMIIGELRDAPDKGIPEDLWEKAQCVLVIPSLKKAAFIVGGEYGSGVMSCRHGKSWSAPVFMQLAKGSWGLQIGAQSIDLVLLAMNQRGVDKLLQDKVSLGVDASVAAGPVGRTAAAATDAQLSAELLSYSRAQGLFAGIDLSGGVLRPDEDSNTRAYGDKVTVTEIVNGSKGVAAPQAASAFLRTLQRDVRATSGKK